MTSHKPSASYWFSLVWSLDGTDARDPECLFATPIEGFGFSPRPVHVGY